MQGNKRQWIWLPLVLFCLLLGSWGAPPALAQPTLMQDILFDQARGTLVFQLPGSLNAALKYFDHPDRLVMDLPEVLLNGPQRTIAVGQAGVTQIRIAQFQKEPAIVRIVFDIAPGSRPSGVQTGQSVPVTVTASGSDHYQLALGGLPLQPGAVTVPLPSAPGALLPAVPVGPSQLSSLEFRAGEVILVATRPLAPPTITQSADGHLCTVTFPGLIAPVGLNELPVKSTEVKGVRIVTLTAATQLLVDLNVPMTYTFRQEAGGRSIRLVPGPWTTPPALPLPPNLPSNLTVVQSLTAQSQGDRTDVIIQADKPLQYRIVRLAFPERVQVDIPQAILATGLPPTITNRDPLTQVQVTQATPDSVRIVLDLTTYGQFESALSADGKELRIGLLNLVHAPARGAQLITLDPGHGGTDPGAIGPHGTTEAQVTLAVAGELRTILATQGKTVLLTRATDVEVDLQPRVDVANQNHANILVSIHCNSSTNHDAYGVETYYKWPPSLPLARAIHRRMVLQVQAPDRGVRRANFYMVNHTTMPAVLVEIGYVSNPAEELRLASPAYQHAVAQAIADGIVDFLAGQK